MAFLSFLTFLAAAALAFFAASRSACAVLDRKSAPTAWGRWREK